MDPMANVEKLSTSLAQLSVRIDKFAEDIQDAKQDMGDLSDKLASLEECLETLESDFENPAVQYGDRQRRNLKKLLDDCDRISKEMITLLKSFSDGGNDSWSGFSKTKMEKLQDSLEEDRSTIVLIISMKKRSSAEENRINRIANSTQDTESMMSVHQSLLETAPVPYAKEDPYTKHIESQQMTTRPQRSEFAPTSKSNDHTIGRSSMRTNTTLFTKSPMEVRNTGQYSAPLAQEQARNLPIDTLNRSSTHSWLENQFASPEVPPTRQPGDPSENGQQVLDDWTDRQLIVAPIEKTGEGKEVVPSNVSIKSERTLVSLSEASALNSAHLQLTPGNLDQIAITAAGKARNRLNESERNKADKELLKRVKEGADLSKIQSLLDRGADPDAAGPRNTVLTTEIQYSGRQQVIELLLSRGADPNATSDGIPDYKILEGGNMDRLRSRLRAGRSIDAVPYQVGILFLAALHTNIDLVKLLISYGAALKPRSNSLSRQQTTLSSNERPSLDRRKSSGSQPGPHRSAVLAAAENDKWDIVQLLVLEGADLNETGPKAGSTLQLATAKNKKDLMQLLIERGADVNAQGGQYGSALIAAAYESHPTAAKILLDAGANINAQSKKFGTALNAAVLNGYLNVVKLLLERGADTKIGYVLDTALQRLKDDPDDNNRKAIVRSLEARGAKSGPVDKKVPEWAGLFSDSY